MSVICPKTPKRLFTTTGDYEKQQILTFEELKTLVFFYHFAYKIMNAPSE